MSSNVDMVSIATIHTLFNIVNSVLLMPFTGKIEKLATYAITSKKTVEATPFDTLDERFLDIPTFAIDRCRELVCDMAGIAENSVKDSIGLLWQYNQHTADLLSNFSRIADHCSNIAVCMTLNPTAVSTRMSI